MVSIKLYQNKQNINVEIFEVEYYLKLSHYPGDFAAGCFVTPQLFWQGFRNIGIHL